MASREERMLGPRLRTMPSAFQRLFKQKFLKASLGVLNPTLAPILQSSCGLLCRSAHGNLRGDDGAILRSRTAGRNSAPSCKQPAIADNALDYRSVRRHEYLDLSALVLQR